MQVDKIVGISAPEDFIDRLESMAAVHHERLSVDVIRAYYFGARFLVEVEVVMPADMSVRDSHDIALILQHKARMLPYSMQHGLVPVPSISMV